MINIKQYDMYQLEINNYYSLDRLLQNTNVSYLRMFLLYSFGHIKLIKTIEFIKGLKTNYKDGIHFEEVNIDIDNQNNLVYFSESWYTYNDKPTTPEIERLLEEENFIQLCKIGFLDYIVMTKDNFIYILLAWDKIVDTKSPFALLYQDDKDWYNVLPFDTQDAMEQFVADHTKK